MGAQSGKVPLSFFLGIKLKFPLTLFKGFLFTDVFPYCFFVQSHRAYTVSTLSKTQPRNSFYCPEFAGGSGQYFFLW